MFARNCPPTTSASDMSRTESCPSRQIRSPRSPSTWSECRSRYNCNSPVETGLAPSPQLPQKKGAPKRAQVSGGTKTKQISSNVQQDKLNPRPISASKARRLHRLPRDVRRRRNTLHPQLEFIRVRRALERSLVIHQPRLEQVPERLVKRLHAVLRCASRNCFADRASLFRHQNTFPNIGCRNHAFDRRHSALGIRPPHQSLAHNGAQYRGQLQPNLFLLRWRKNRDDAVNAFHCVQGMQRGENHVPGFGRVQRRPDRFQIAHFADQNHVRILTKRSPQRRRERWRIHFHLALIYVAFFVAVQKFDRVFDRDDMLGASRVDAVHHGSKRRRLARARHPGHQHQSARHVADLLNHLRQKQFVERADLRRNDAQHQSHIAALLKHVHTEASQARNAIRHVDFRGLFEFLLLPRRHHAESHVQHVFSRHARLLGQSQQIAINAQVRIVPHLQMQVRSAALHGDAQQVVDVHAGGTPATVPIIARTAPAHEMTEVMRPLAADQERIPVETRLAASPPAPKTTRYCPKISGSPFFPPPITTTLAFGLFAKSSVASMPFHSRSDGVMPWATICWKSRTPAASIRLRSASCFSFCRRKLIASDSCSACCFDSMEALRVAGNCISRSKTLSTIKPRWPRRLESWSKICLATISRSPV